MKKKELLIVGVGNIYRGDDGIGPEIIKRFGKRKNLKCDLLDGGIDGLALLDKLQEYRRAIIIDAVNMAAESGTIRIFSPQEALVKIHSDTLSTHGFGIAEMIKLMEKLNINTELTIIGIQPVNLSFGQGLSEKIASKIADILQIIDSVINAKAKNL